MDADLFTFLGIKKTYKRQRDLGSWQLQLGRMIDIEVGMANWTRVEQTSI
jgi:hypothetical protein